MNPRPSADPSQVVERDDVRVTVLTERLVRIEYASDGVFEDRPTLTVTNRRFEPVRFTTSFDDGSLVVDTGSLRLVCTDPRSVPTPRTLYATIRGTGGPSTWRFGDPQPDNLGGTVRTLDMWKGGSLQRVTGFDEETGFVREWDPQSLGDGFLSRSGWVTLDDSGTVLAEDVPVPRSENHVVDVYLFAYDNDHRAALSAARRLVGDQPLPPRWAFGYWYSRYYPYTDSELVELVDELDRHGIPVDVLVIDMDWHRPGWTGYSWDGDLFRDPTATLREIHRRGLHVALNLHPADGVARHEDAFPDMCAALGVDPDSTDRIPFDPTDPAFMDAYFRVLHHPQEDRGVDFWWLDWQQGTESDIEGLDPLAWLNEMHWRDQDRHRGRRPLNFSRWDGIGAARRPVGFSGDTFASWESLGFQPHFTATAANVLFGYWSHDIGGHYGGSADAELYLRWIQFGVYSPVLRTHGSVDIVEERRIWEYPSPFRQAMIAAVRRRYELIPYIYTACATGASEGRSLVRPMYHDLPDLEIAYDLPGQYAFGEDMIVSPVVEPADTDGIARARTWLPPGSWYDVTRGRLIEVLGDEGLWLDLRYLIDETPVFVRGGSIVPTQSGVTRTGTAFYENLHFQVHPGGDSVGVLHEDDGTTTGYTRAERVLVRTEHHHHERTRTFGIVGAEGTYPRWAPRRRVTVSFIGEIPPERVSVDGTTLPGPTTSRGTASGGRHWRYDTARTAVVVELGEVDLRTPLRVDMHRDTAAVSSIAPSLDGLPGLVHRLGTVDRDVRVLMMQDDSRLLANVARTPLRIDADPRTFAREVSELPAKLDRLRGAFTEAVRYWAQGEALDPTSPPRATTALGRAGARFAMALEEHGDR